MKPSPRRMALALALGLTLTGTITWLVWSAHFSPDTEEARAGEREREAEEHFREDQPDEAAAFAKFKRLPEGATEVPVERYLIARDQMRQMPQYSTAQGRFLPAQNERTAQADLGALGTWTSLGPGNVGGRTRALIIRQDDPNTMYAAGVAGGVWKTTNGGASWTPLADMLANIAVNSLAMDPTNPNILYAGTGEGVFNGDSVRGVGIFKTIDGGANWSYLSNTNSSDFFYVNKLIISLNNSQRVYAATRTGVWRSTDGGATWTQVLNPSLNGGCLDLVIRTDQTTDYIFAACGTAAGVGTAFQSSIYRNTDAGGAGVWSVVQTEAGMARTSLAIAPSDQSVIYAVSAEGATGTTRHSLHAVFRSQSNGDSGTWTAQVRSSSPVKLNTVLLSNPREAFNPECNGTAAGVFNQGWYDNTIAVDPADPNRVWVGGIDLFRSDDGGANWGIASYWDNSLGRLDFAHADQHVLVFHPQYNGTTNQTLFVGDDGGIFRSDNARAATNTSTTAACRQSSNSSALRWTSLNNSYAVTQFYHGLPYPNGTTYFGGAQDNGTQRGTDASGPNAWTRIQSGDGGYVAVDPTNTNVLYAEFTNLSLVKSSNGGTSFSNAVSGITESSGNFMFTTPFTMDPSDPQRLWIGGTMLWRTKNAASLWRQASTTLAGGSVSAIAIAPTNANAMLAATSSGFIHRTSIGLTSDATTTWPNTRPRTGFASWLAFDPTNANIAYATYSTFGGSHVWRSIDAGANWTAIDGTGVTGIPDIPVHCIVVDPANTARLYVGTDLGVFVSTDVGATWAIENTGFANVITDSLALNTISGTTSLFAFTHGRGAWRVTAGSGCGYTLSAANQSFGVAGGSGGSVSVTSAPGSCSWTATSNDSWITINSGSSGSGNGNVTFSVAANTSGPRSGTIAIAGRSLTINQAGATVSASAASFATAQLASEAIASAFGANMATATLSASTLPLPTSLSGTTVQVTDSLGATRSAPLFFVSAGQINYQIPQGTANGTATITITSGDGTISTGTLQIVTVAPGLFTSNSFGTGAPAAIAVHAKLDGSQPSELMGNADGTTRQIDLGPAGEIVVIELFGTGLRNRTSLSAVTAGIGNVPPFALDAARFEYAGPAPGFAGLDQINVQIPRTLVGSGEVNLVLTVDGKAANTIKVNFK